MNKLSEESITKIYNDKEEYLRLNDLLSGEIDTEDKQVFLELIKNNEIKDVEVEHKGLAVITTFYLQDFKIIARPVRFKEFSAVEYIVQKVGEDLG